MAQLRFDGRVAIVTGAGGQPPSLGRAFAMLLASRGARVVVNDLGVGPDGRCGLAADAQGVVNEITDAGGEAIADTHSVSEPGFAVAIVKTALDAWGRIDILVNNAGVVAIALFDEISDEDCDLIVRTHLLGSVWMCRAVWPHMKAAGYGRIVNIGSNATFGTAYNAVYGSAKAGMLGLARGLALEGSRHGVKVNALAPSAGTRKHAYLMEPAARFVEQGRARTVEQVAPAVAFLCHEECQLSGAFLFSGGGTTSSYSFARSPGYANPRLTIEDVRDNLGTIVERAGSISLDGLDTGGFDTIRPKPYQPRAG